MKSWLSGGYGDGVIREDGNQPYLEPELEIFGFPDSDQPERRGLGKRTREGPGQTGRGFIKRQASVGKTDGTVIITVTWRGLPATAGKHAEWELFLLEKVPIRCF